jgi:hypothetical protein
MTNSMTNLGQHKDLSQNKHYIKTMRELKEKVEDLEKQNALLRE